MPPSSRLSSRTHSFSLISRTSTHDCSARASSLDGTLLHRHHPPFSPPIASGVTHRRQRIVCVLSHSMRVSRCDRISISGISAYEHTARPYTVGSTEPFSPSLQESGLPLAPQTTQRRQAHHGRKRPAHRACPAHSERARRSARGGSELRISYIRAHRPGAATSRGSHRPRRSGRSARRSPG